MTRQQLIEAALALPGAYEDYPFGEDVTVIKIGQGESAKMFALVRVSADPPQISLKCDPGLARLLREKYESVMPGYHLNKKHWNTILCTGQLSDDEIVDLIRHSYELVR